MRFNDGIILMLSKVDTIKQKILEEMANGHLKPGDALYSRHQFMKRYACSRGSIDTAIKELTRDGYVFSRQGAGTYVAELFPRTEEVNRVYVVENFRKLYTADDLTYTSYIVSEIQRSVPCFLYRADEININLKNIVRPGSAVIWVRPSYDKMLLMDYINSAGIPQVLIGRRYGDYDYIDTDVAAGLDEGLEWLKSNCGERIAFIGIKSKTDYPYVAERQIALYQKLIEKRMSIPPAWLHVRAFTEREQDLERTVDELFSSRDDFPRAIYVDFCNIITRLTSMIDKRGFKLGQDYRLLAFDYIKDLAGTPGVGMLSQRHRLMEEKAAEWAVSARKDFKLTIKPEFLCWE